MGSELAEFVGTGDCQARALGQGKSSSPLAVAVVITWGQLDQYPLGRHFLLSSDFVITFSQVVSIFFPQKYKAKLNRTIGMVLGLEFFFQNGKAGLNCHELNLHPLHRKSWQGNA